MKSVLIIGPNFHYFMQSIERGFAALGYDTKVECYDDPIHPYNLANKIIYKLVDNKDNIKEKSRKKWQKYIEQKWAKFNPDLVFIVNGNNLLPQSIKLFATKSNVIFWLFDSITRFPEISANLTDAARIFCYEKDDIYLLKQKGIEASFLPQAVDETLYYPISCEKIYDIVFCGDIYHSKRRKEYLDAIIEAFPNAKIAFYGIAWPWYKGLFKYLTRKHRAIYKNKNLCAEKLNLLYNQAKVVINIHHEQQKNGANPKVYEIAATGAYQICDENEYIKECFGDKIALYKTKEELICLINDALINHKTNSNLLIDNTFTDRIKQMLNQ